VPRAIRASAKRRRSPGAAAPRSPPWSTMRSPLLTARPLRGT